MARICYVIVGMLLGTVVTPETLRGVTTWPASIALLMLASLGMMAATMSYLRMVHRWDPLSALLGASPGSMAQVIALSTELGGDLRAIAIVQTVRVLLLVIGLPNGLALFGLVVPAVPVAARAGRICRAWRNDAFAGGRDRLRHRLLALAVSRRAVVRRHGGIGDPARQRAYSRRAAVVDRQQRRCSCSARWSARASPTPALRMLVGFLGAALGSFAVSMAVATFFILIVAHLFRFPIANIVIAFSPGAQDTMMVLALALHLDPVYVGAHHLARFLVITFSLAVAARRVAGKPCDE